MAGDVDRVATDGDQVTIDIEGTVDGEAVEGLTTSNYLYEVGVGAVVPEIDENLRGASTGDTLEFDAEHPDGGDKRLQRLMRAQDTGNASRGAVRGDFYWGTGRAALDKASRMKSRGAYYILLPRAMMPTS